MFIHWHKDNFGIESWLSECCERGAFNKVGGKEAYDSYIKFVMRYSPEHKYLLAGRRYFGTSLRNEHAVGQIKSGVVTFRFIKLKGSDNKIHHGPTISALESALNSDENCHIVTPQNVTLVDDAEEGEAIVNQSNDL